jgi:hypothetical protein
MTPSHDQFSKRFATVRFVMGQAFQQHFVGHGRKPDTADRIIRTAAREFKRKGLDVRLDPKSVKWLGWVGNFTGLEIIARIDGIEQKIVMDTAIAARRMRGEA